MNDFTGVLGVVGSISGKRTFLLVMGLECFIPGLKNTLELAKSMAHLHTNLLLSATPQRDFS